MKAKVEKKVVYDCVAKGVSRLRLIEVPVSRDAISDEDVISMIPHCLVCGNKYVLRDGLCLNCDIITTSVDREMLINNYLEEWAKPWKDPQSLFCSPRLKEIIGKEPLKGKECKDGV